MIKFNRLKLTVWKVRARVLIDYAHVSPDAVIELAQSIIDDIDEVEAKEEKDWLETLEKEYQERKAAP